MRRNDSQATVSLVALCFVAVLGIVLASYIAVCSRAMNLSNRTFQRTLGQQLAETGLEEGLRAFNTNDWSNWSSTPGNMTSGAWTFDATNKRATRTINFNSGKLGQSVTATVKIRIDNYDAAQLGSTWASSRNYRINDLVGYNGIWYRALENHLSAAASTPGNLRYWAQSPISWAWCKDINYQQYAVVNHNATWYRCRTGNIDSAPAASNNDWARIPTLSLAWSGSTSYEDGSFVYHNGTWHRCTTNGNTSEPPGAGWNSTGAPHISWSWRTGSYKFDDTVYYNGTWYRCKVASSNANPTSSEWENALSGTNHGWIAGANYNLGDAVYSVTTNQWHRCILAHTSNGSNGPTTGTTAYWTNTPRFDTAWSSTRSYNQHDLVRYNGVWYLSLQNTNEGLNPETATIYWIGANTTSASYVWSASTAYTTSSPPQSYGGAWYKCLIANTGQSPNNITYWTPSWKNGWQPNSTDAMGAPVIYGEATVSITGTPALKTQLRAAINPAPLFSNAIGATGAIELNAGGTVASYNSTTDPTASTLDYSAVIASSRAIPVPGVKIVSATVQGYVAAPATSSLPYGSSTQFGSSAVVKSSTSSPSPKVDPSRVSRSPYVPQFSTLPSGAGGLASNFSTVPKGTRLPLATVVNIGTPGAPAPSRYYFDGSLSMSGATIQTLNINGPVIIFISGGLTMNSAGAISNINDTGSAEIHIGGSFNVTATSEGIKNNASSPDPKKLAIICDTTGAGTLAYGEGTNDFYGVIYAPNTSATSGLEFPNTDTEVFGAVSAAKVTFDNNATLYYDTSLRYAPIPGVAQPYSVTDLRELPATEQATIP